MARYHVSATVNGDEVEFLCEPEQTLLDVLRDELHLTGTKEGCASGDCGACSVMLDGRLVCSCLVMGAEAGDCSIETIEGMADGERLHPLQQKFLDYAALQCGYCTPGLLVAAKALLERSPDPTEIETRYWLAGNLCRCTGYDKIIRAVLDTAAGNARRVTMSAAEDLGYQEKPHELKWVGTNVARTDGVDKVTGRARFGADLIMPGMLFGAVLRSPHAHARINGIDTSKAEAVKGVKAVITREDFEDQPSEMIQVGELTVNIRDVIRNVLAREKVMYDGHAVAAVAATSASVARKALKLIEVDYEVLPHVIDVVEAMQPDAPLLNEDQFTDGVHPKPDRPSNVAKRLEIKLGDVEKGFAEADVVIEREYKTRPVHQGLHRAARLCGELYGRRPG